MCTRHELNVQSGCTGNSTGIPAERRGEKPAMPNGWLDVIQVLDDDAPARLAWLDDREPMWSCAKLAAIDPIVSDWLAFVHLVRHGGLRVDLLDASPFWAAVLRTETGVSADLEAARVRAMKQRHKA